jgi:hypothetical protein
MIGQNVSLILLVVFTTLCLSPKTESKAPDVNKNPALMLNIDCTNYFYGKSPEQISGASLDAYVDSILSSGATILLINTQAQRANYDSKAIEPFWQGFDPGAGNDQPCLAGLSKEAAVRWHRLVTAMLTLHQQGVDYPQRIIERCRQKKVSPWISLRMNDTHNNDNIDHPMHSELWVGHPEYWRIRDRKVDYYDRTFDYAHQAVRDHFMGLIEETLDRYDIDGLELDFLREPYIFKIGRESENRRLLTDWMKIIKNKVDAAAKQRGHDIGLSVRIPAWPQTAKNLGFDIVRWADLGLIDCVVASPRWATIDNNQPISLWADLLRDTDVTLAGGLEVRYQPFADGPAQMASPEIATGTAASLFDRGADVIYLFNYFFMHFARTEWDFKAFQERLGAMADPQSCYRQSRRHVLTYPDVQAHGEPAAALLPSVAGHHFFRLYTGPKPENRSCQVLIGTMENPSLNPCLRVNNVPCALKACHSDTLIYEIPDAAITAEQHTIEVISTDDTPLTITRVEFFVTEKK